MLSDISFTIKPGTKLALVGESGQGKNHHFKFVCSGFITSMAVDILIDGTDVASVTQASLRSAVGVVFQETRAV